MLVFWLWIWWIMACALSEIVFVIQLLESLATAKYAKQLAIKVSKAHWTQLLLTRGLSTSSSWWNLYITQICLAAASASLFRLLFLNFQQYFLKLPDVSCHCDYIFWILSNLVWQMKLSVVRFNMTKHFYKSVLSDRLELPSAWRVRKNTRGKYGLGTAILVIEILLAEKCVTANQWLDPNFQFHLTPIWQIK